MVSDQKLITMPLENMHLEQQMLTHGSWEESEERMQRTAYHVAAGLSSGLRDHSRAPRLPVC